MSPAYHEIPIPILLLFHAKISLVYRDAEHQYPEGFQLWTPLALGETGGTFVKHGEGMMLLKAIARLKLGVTLQQAQAELQTIAQRIQPGGPTEPGGGEGAGGGEGVFVPRLDI